MCVTYIIDGEPVRGVRRLIELIGIDNIRLDGAYPRRFRADYLTSDNCLCPLDMAATARSAGYTPCPDSTLEHAFNGIPWKRTVH